MTKVQIESCTRKVLAEMARKKGLADWRSLDREQLIKALSSSRSVKVARGSKRLDGKQATPAPKVNIAAAKPALQPTAARKTSAAKGADRKAVTPALHAKDLAGKAPSGLPGGYRKDRIVVMARDPYWLHAYWELTRQSVQRAESALGQDWHGARPILRLQDVTSQDTTSSAEVIVRDIDIHGGCNNWYIDVPNPPRSYRIDIGYLSRPGRFYVLASSNIVTTPKAGVSDAIDNNWADIDEKKADRIYAMSGGYEGSPSNLSLKQLLEERLRRPLGAPAVNCFGAGSWPPGRQRKFWFDLDAELIIYGSTQPHARITLLGEPVALRPDGTFTMRFSLPDSRQIIPAVATSADGVEERTIVLAIERNTKQLEPMIHDGND